MTKIIKGDNVREIEKEFRKKLIDDDLTMKEFAIRHKIKIIYLRNQFYKGILYGKPRDVVLSYINA